MASEKTVELQREPLLKGTHRTSQILLALFSTAETLGFFRKTYKSNLKKQKLLNYSKT